jgi:hypothetical protein
MASIWLLRGNVGPVMVRNCDELATTAFCSLARRFFARNSGGYGYGFVNAISGPAQSSLKSD